ncbi:MAG: type IV pilus twitching motility protein PilT [Lachnospiraceae bacterium]|nr:type IV pilus twitching motility protein PilT [Lachnospiraceae bacterium]
MVSLRELFQVTEDPGYSDYHISVGAPVVVRYHGALRNFSDEVLTKADVNSLLREVMSDKQLETLEMTGEVDFASTLDDGSRLRCNAYREKNGYALALRKLPSVIPKLEELGTPASLARTAQLRQGLVLITGPTGSGKSTTQAALLNDINLRESRHIITLEAPIEYIHENQKSLIHQREVGEDTESFAEGLRAALRQDPDVILIGEMRDLETISTAITAAETGHLVFGTLHTKSAAQSIDRMIDVFPIGQQEEIRAQLANVLECIASQELVPSLDGKRTACYEILVMTPAVRNLIREKKVFQISSTMQSSRKAGMIVRDDALYDLYKDGVISDEMALAYATDKEAMQRRLLYAVRVAREGI